MRERKREAEFEEGDCPTTYVTNFLLKDFFQVAAEELFFPSCFLLPCHWNLIAYGKVSFFHSHTHTYERTYANKGHDVGN